MKDETQLRKEIDDLVAKLQKKDSYPNYTYPQFVIIDLGILTGKIAAINDIVSRRNELISRRLVCLTYVLVTLTFALLAVEVRAMIFPKNPKLEVESKQQTQDYDVVRPSIPKSQNP